MKLTENTVAAILAVLLIASTCTVLLVGGLYMSPVSGEQRSSNDVTASTHD